MCAFEKDKLELATNLFEGIINKFKKIKNLELNIDCINAPENKHKYSSEAGSSYQKEIVKREKNAKHPVYVDFKKLLQSNKLEKLELNFDENIGTRLKNVMDILKNKSLKGIKIDGEKFETKGLEKIFETIGTEREKYLLNYNKKNKGKAVRWASDMDEESAEEYRKIKEKEEEEYELEIDGLSVLNILIDRCKGEK